MTVDMISYALAFLAGVALLPACAYVRKLCERVRDWIRRKRGIPCPLCKDDGYIEDVDIESRSISMWPCRCAKGREFTRKMQMKQ